MDVPHKSLMYWLIVCVVVFLIVSSMISVSKVSGIETKGFPANTTSPTRSEVMDFVNHSNIFLATSNLEGGRSSASILVDTSRAITISIQFFLIVCLFEVSCGLDRSIIEEKSMSDSMVLCMISGVENLEKTPAH